MMMASWEGKLHIKRYLQTKKQKVVGVDDTRILLFIFFWGGGGADTINIYQSVGPRCAD